MSKRPVFEPETEGNNLVTKHIIEFTWYPGFAKEQKQKSLESLHVETKKNTNINTILEISTKSKESLGIDASAFNIKIKTKKGLTASVESFYQGSKVFENGGPYKDLYECSSLDSKKDERLKSSGELIGFEFEETKWGLNDHFYDWLYLNALLQNKNISDQICMIKKSIRFSDKTDNFFDCSTLTAYIFRTTKSSETLYTSI